MYPTRAFVVVLQFVCFCVCVCECYFSRRVISPINISSFVYGLLLLFFSKLFVPLRQLKQFVICSRTQCVNSQNVPQNKGINTNILAEPFLTIAPNEAHAVM